MCIILPYFRPSTSMDVAFSQEHLDFQEDVRNFLASEYPLDIKEKQDKTINSKMVNIFKLSLLDLIPRMVFTL